MKKPILRHMTGRHACLEDSIALLLLLGEDRTLLFEYFDQAPQHINQNRAGIETQAWRNERGIGLEAACSVAKQPNQWQRHKAIRDFRFCKQKEILSTDLHGLLVQSRVLVWQFLLMRSIADCNRI